MPIRFLISLVALLAVSDLFATELINLFHYPEAEHMTRAKADIERMGQAEVDAYRIDAVYGSFLRP